MGEGFADPHKPTPGHPGSLFVTRQQQVKAEQEKRRLEAKASSVSEKDTEESLSKDQGFLAKPLNSDSKGIAIFKCFVRYIFE